MRILLSAYSCEPGRGSEPGIGWNTAVELGRSHDVWVITKARHRGPIEAELARHPRPNVRFVYHDAPLGRWPQLHYYLWQYSAYPVARRLCREVPFDVALHATWGRFWSPSLFALLPVPFVWAGVSGGEVVPRGLRPCLSRANRFSEWFKEVFFGLAAYDPFVRLTARRAALVLANHRTTADRLAPLMEGRVDFLETAVVDQGAVGMIDDLDEPPPRSLGDPVTFATLTRLEPWKGVHLGLRAFAQMNDPRGRYLVVGEGPQRGPLERLARDLGIAERVEFLGNPSRLEWMRVLKRCHALVHPVLAAAFNTIALEAMLCSRPVIAFRTDYMADRLGEDTSYFVESRTPAAAVAGLADAMRQVADDPQDAARRGQRGRERALRRFTWGPRIERLERWLADVVSAGRTTPTT